MTLSLLQQNIHKHLTDTVTESVVAYDELTIEIPHNKWLSAASILRDEPTLAFDQCVDLCGVDYLSYGLSEWETNQATKEGFERGVIADLAKQEPIYVWTKPRFAVVYHLLSLSGNTRLRVRVFPEIDNLLIDSVTSIWPAVNWYERE